MKLNLSTFVAMQPELDESERGAIIVVIDMLEEINQLMRNRGFETAEILGNMLTNQEFDTAITVLRNILFGAFYPTYDRPYEDDEEIEIDEDWENWGD